MKDRKDLENEKRMADVILDRGQDITIAGKKYTIKAPKMYTRILISESFNKMELAEKETLSIVEAMFHDIPELAKIITYAILRDKERVESAEFDKVYTDVLECDNMQEYMDAVTVLLDFLDIEWFFFIVEAVKNLNILPSKAGYKRKIQALQEREYTQVPVSLATSQE